MPEVKLMQYDLFHLHEDRKEDEEMLDVWDMHNKFGFVRNAYPSELSEKQANDRYNFMLEELSEFKKAFDENDFPGMADALIDLVYVAKGTAVMMGLPWEDLWQDVHRANMSKERGTTARGMDEDLVKPTGWKAPETRKILIENGWAPDKEDQ